MTLRSLRALALGSLLAFAGATSALAGPGALMGVSANPNPATTGANVVVTLTKTGTSCGFKIDYGDGTIDGPFGFSTSSKSISHVYAQAGTFTISVWGKIKGNKPACKGGTKTTQIAVNKGGGIDRVPGKKPQLGPKKPGPNILMDAPKGMKLIKLAVQAQATPGKDHAKFKVTANRKATLKLRVFGLPGYKACDETVNPLKATFALGKKTSWSTQILGLAHSKKHFWEVCASDEHGNTARASGQFKTGSPLVEVTFDMIKITDDSDDLSDGDLYFFFEAGGKKVAHSQEGNDGTGDLFFTGKAISFIASSQNASIKIIGGDNDTDGFIMVPTSIPNGDYEDWGAINKTVPVSTAGTTMYNWKANHHGLGFDAQVTVRVAFE